MTAAEWQMMQAVHMWACSYCGVFGVKLTRDHVIPLNRGGEHNIKNIVPACLQCNSSKGDKTVAEWKAWRKLRQIGVSGGH